MVSASNQAVSSSHDIASVGGGSVGAGAASAPASVYLTHFTCNMCSCLLTGTVYHTMCDCIFCEDCTWRHFEKYSSCAKCGRVLGEDDFTELVVGTDTDFVKKVCLQTMMNVPGETSQRRNMCVCV